MLTVVIPTLDAARSLGATIACCAAFPVVVADGGSTDGTVALACSLGVRVVRTAPGRGGQLAAGAAAAGGEWLLFLHADTRLEPGWAAVARRFMADPANLHRAGYFRFALDDASPPARRLERLVAWRCWVLALPYGDQGLLMSRALYEAAGGFRPLPLMEDVDLVRRLGRARLVALPVPAVTSAERWQREGYTRRSARNLACLTLWFAGVPPRIIRRLY